MCEFEDRDCTFNCRSQKVFARPGQRRCKVNGVMNVLQRSTKGIRRGVIENYHKIELVNEFAQDFSLILNLTL